MIFVILWTVLGIGIVLFIWFKQESAKKKSGTANSFDSFASMEKIYNHFLRHMDRVDVSDVAQLLGKPEDIVRDYLGQMEAMGTIKRQTDESQTDYFILDTANQSSVFRVYN